MILRFHKYVYTHSHIEIPNCVYTNMSVHIRMDVYTVLIEFCSINAQSVDSL